MQAADVGHGFVAADDGQQALVAVAERRRVLAQAAVAQHLGHVLPLLHSHLGHAGQRLTVLLIVGQVADDEDVGVAGQRQVRPDDEATGAVLLRPGALGQHRAQRGSAHARTPQDGVGGNAGLFAGGILDDDVAGGDLGHQHAGAYLHAQSGQ